MDMQLSVLSEGKGPSDVFLLAVIYPVKYVASLKGQFHENFFL